MKTPGINGCLGKRMIFYPHCTVCIQLLKSDNVVSLRFTTNFGSIYHVFKNFPCSHC